MIDALGKHPGEEQRVVANMFSHLALTIERRRGAVHGIGLNQHLADIGDLTVVGIANLEKLLGVAKLREQVGYVSDNLRITNTDLFRIMPADQILKQRLQRMRFRSHKLCPPELRANPGVSTASVSRYLSLLPQGK